MLTELVECEYYLNSYGDCGIPKSSFDKLNRKASRKINTYTFGRITDMILDDNIRDTACEIIELLYSQEQLITKLTDDKVKVSETVGPHTVSYINKANLQVDRILSKEELDGNCYQICYEHLVSTGLMDRSVL